MTSKKPEQNTAVSDTAEPKAAPAPARPRRPTPEQLQALTDGGSYTFDPTTGRFDQKRKGTELKEPKRA